MCCDVDVSAASLMRIIGGRLLCGGGARRSRAPAGSRCVRPLRSLRHVAGALASRAAVRARGVAFVRRRCAPHRRQRRRGCRGRDPQYLTCRRRPVLTTSPNILTSVLSFPFGGTSEYRKSKCTVFTARCHASAVLAMGLCLCPCLSVTSRSSTKTAKRRITQTTQHDSPGTLVFCSQRSPRNLTGVTPYGGTKCRWGGSKSATFHK